MAKAERAALAAAAPPRLPPARSGPKVLIALIIVSLLFLGALWYASSLALHARGPDRAFLRQAAWDNGTILLGVTELDAEGEVLAAGLTVRIVSQANERLFDGPPGSSQNISNFTLTVAFLDLDNSSTLTVGDEFTITAYPAAGLDDLILSTFYLFVGDQEWAREPLPASGL